MTDRVDPSQFDTDQGNENDESFYGVSTMDNDQIQTQPGGSYAESGEMTSFVDPGLTQDYMKDSPGNFRTATTRGKTRLVAQARPTPPNSGQMVNGAGVLRGFSFVADDAGPYLIRLRDGADGNAQPIVHLTDKNGAPSVYMFPVPIQFRYGLFFELVAGSSAGQGCIYTDELQG